MHDVFAARRPPRRGLVIFLIWTPSLAAGVTGLVLDGPFGGAGCAHPGGYGGRIILRPFDRCGLTYCVAARLQSLRSELRDGGDGLWGQFRLLAPV